MTHLDRTLRASLRLTVCAAALCFGATLHASAAAASQPAATPKPAAKPAPAPQRPAIKLVLPLSGYALQATPPAGQRAATAGVWSFDPAKGQQMAIDVVDAYAAEKQVGSTWVNVSRTGLSCEARLAQLGPDEVWHGQVTLAGTTATARATHRDLGPQRKVQVVSLCATDALGWQLLVYHHLLGLAADAPRDQATKQVIADAWPAAIVEAFSRARIVPTQGVLTPGLRNGGARPANAVVRLPQNGLDITLPNDGSVWAVLPGRVDEGSGLATDDLVRLVPIRPEARVSLYVDPDALADLGIGDDACDAALAAVGVFSSAEMLRGRPTGAPVGWRPGNIEKAGAGRRLTACWPGRAGPFVATVLMEGESTDLSSVAELLKSISAANP